MSAVHPLIISLWGGGLHSGVETAFFWSGILLVDVPRQPCMSGTHEPTTYKNKWLISGTLLDYNQHQGCSLWPHWKEKRGRWISPAKYRDK